MFVIKSHLAFFSLEVTSATSSPFPCTHEISTRKNFVPTKYPREHDATMARNPRWHEVNEI